MWTSGRSYIKRFGYGKDQAGEVEGKNGGDE